MMKTGPRTRGLFAGLSILLAACAGLAADRAVEGPGPAVLPGSQAGHQIPAFTRHLRAISFTSHLLHLDGGFPGNHRDIPLLRIARVYLKDLQRRVAGRHSADHNSKQRA